MNRQFPKGSIISHPCFSMEAHGKYGRIHLPVAPICNIGCNYCDRKYDCVNESRPGVSSRILSPTEAMERVRVAIERQRITVVGVAGPGDPLANDTTFEFFRLLRREIPEAIPCLSTNGLCLSQRLELLEELGIWTVTITINSVRASIAEKIYSWIFYDGRLFKAKEAAEILIENQWKGLEMLSKKGFYIKVNSVLIPGINEGEIEEIAKKAKRLRATAMNIIPLIPNGKLRYLQKPSCELIDRIRKECERHIPQIKHCRHCRADASGRLDEDRDMELELINVSLGEDYNERIY